MFGLSALTLVYEQSLHNDIIQILHASDPWRMPGSVG